MVPTKQLTFLAGGAGILAFLAYSLAQERRPQVAGATPPVLLAIRITSGHLQERETDYSGTLTLNEGHVAEIIPWRFFGGARLDGSSSWTLHTRRANIENQPDDPRLISTPGANQNIVPKAISAVVDAPSTANAKIETRRGTYAFRLAELRSGRVLTFEDGDVTVQSVPPSHRISPASQANAPVEPDYPSFTIASDGSAWAAWQAYQDKGDRILGAHSTASGWAAIEPLTAGGLDVYRTAVGEDVGKRVWVVWSHREGESWDLVARVNHGRGWSAPR